MKKLIFREYDIRGVVDRDFDLKDAFAIGQGYGALLQARGGRTVAVGRDCRLTSDRIRDALVKGLTSTGLRVVDVGVCPTPLLYFSLHHLRTDGGIMITASHNPPEYNGFKLCVGQDTLFGEAIQEFREIVEAGRFPTGAGDVETCDIVKPYSDYLNNNIRLDRPVRFALDAGNGTGGVVAAPLFQRLGSPAVELFCDMDGRFPNHDPDPTVPANMEALAETVVRQGLELGIGLDGDSDRIGAVDEKGRIIFGDMLLDIFARDILRDHPGTKVVADVKSSKNLYDDIQRFGGRPIMWRTGHSLIKQKLREDPEVLLAGEMSGHIFFRHRYLGYDDGIYAACRLLEIVSRRKEPVSEFLNDVPPVFVTPEIRVECPEEKKRGLVDLVKADFARQFPIIDVDGVRVLFPDGWGLLRASNTGPILTLRFEAESEARLAEIQALFENKLKQYEDKV